MRKLILCAALLVVNLGLSFSQCTPDAQYTKFGLYSNKKSTTDTAYVGEAYNQVITAVIPTDTIVPYNGANVPVKLDTLRIESITGGPTAITYNCQNAKCTTLGGKSGCLQLVGTPTLSDIGTYNLTISAILAGIATTTVATVTYTSPVSYPYSNSTYKLIVKVRGSSGIEERMGFHALKNSPNPCSSETSIAFNSTVAEQYDFNVIDMYGRVVFSDKISALSGDNTYVYKVRNLSDGIYTYTLKNKNGAQSQRMMIVH